MRYAFMVLVGIIAGGITSLVGASGVMVVVPGLNMGFGLTVQQAIGTSLMVDVIASAAVSFTYFRHGNMDVGRGLWIALGSVAGAQLGASFAAGLPEHRLGGAFGVFLVIFGVVMWWRGFNTEALASRVTIRSTPVPEWQRIVIAVGLGFLLGVVSGVLGAGGGVMVLLVLILVLDFPLHKAIGTSTLIMAITALSGAVGHALRGNVDLVAGLVVGVGTVIGGVAGARFANRMSERVLGRAIAVVFIVLGIVMTVLPRLQGSA
jgi:hypothetical protein